MEARARMFQHGQRNADQPTAPSYYDVLRTRVTQNFNLVLLYIATFIFALTVTAPYYIRVSIVPVSQQYLEYLLFANTYTVIDSTIENVAEIYVGANACIWLVKAGMTKEIMFMIIFALQLASDRFSLFVSTIFCLDWFVWFVRQFGPAFEKLTSLGVMVWVFAGAVLGLEDSQLEDFAIPYIFYVALIYVDKKSIPLKFGFMVLVVSVGWTVVKCIRNQRRAQPPQI